MSLLHIGGSSGTSVVEADGVDFDGTNDYLTRSSDLVGNVDSKTFTFSAWVYTKNNEATDYLFSNWDGGNGDFYVFITNTGAFRAIGRNTSNNIIFSVTSSILIPLNTWTNILISIDLSSTSLRHLYINDVLDTPTWNTYSNQLIDFTGSSFVVSATGPFASIFEGRLSNLFLDYQYRDLSIEANRRLFITADGKPTPTATLKALNPILYLPMKDAATAHINEGTGGNFTLNGTIATSNRGANQDNCVASKFDGVDDYLSLTASSAITKAVTFSFVSKRYNASNRGCVISETNQRIHVVNNDASSIQFRASNSSSTIILSITLAVDMTTTHLISISVDLATSTYTASVDGVIVVGTTTTLTNDFIGSTKTMTIGKRGDTTGNQWDGTLGELYFDTNYIDLATNNPFWDSINKKPIPVRKAMATLGSNPLICMPIDASNPGKNYGSGGDFTANSAPYVGARGASEFWARSAKFDGSTGYLSRGALTGAVNSKTFSFVLPIYKNTNTTAGLLQGLSPSLYFVSNSANQIQVYARNASNSIALSAITTESIPINTWGLLFVCIDMSNTANRFIYFGNIAQTVTWSTYINDSLGFNNTGYQIGNQTSNYLNGSGHGFYFTTDYIDFSQEVNRLKFVDGLGYPLDLAKQIDAGVIPKPLIYLPFNDPSNLGLNLGTGGNFSVVGTVTQGADFSL